MNYTIIRITEKSGKEVVASTYGAQNRSRYVCMFLLERKSIKGGKGGGDVLSAGLCLNDCNRQGWARTNSGAPNSTPIMHISDRNPINLAFICYLLCTLLTGIWMGQYLILSSYTRVFQKINGKDKRFILCRNFQNAYIWGLQKCIHINFFTP